MGQARLWKRRAARPEENPSSLYTRARAAPEPRTNRSAS